jgi:hypothetical protein
LLRLGLLRVGGVATLVRSRKGAFHSRFHITHGPLSERACDHASPRDNFTSVGFTSSLASVRLRHHHQARTLHRQRVPSRHQSRFLSITPANVLVQICNEMASTIGISIGSTLCLCSQFTPALGIKVSVVAIEMPIGRLSNSLANVRVPSAMKDGVSMSAIEMLSHAKL